MNKPEYIIIHTAAWPGDPSSLDVDRSHKERGFNEIGYHYLIRKSGIVEAGRNEKQVGAHCRNDGMNRRSIGICMSGHHNQEEWTDKQMHGLTRLIGRLMNAYDIPAEKVIGHNEAGAAKDCPGTMVNMTTFRSELKTRFM